MGDYWFLVSAATIAIPFVAIYCQSRSKSAHNGRGCPNCHHDCGLNTAGRCDTTEPIGGWVDDDCNCTDDYHRQPANSGYDL